jgi:hypothetical protein
LTYHPQVYLDLGDADFPRLRRDAERLVRGLFEQAFQARYSLIANSWPLFSA